MYIPIWIIVIGAVAYFIWKSRKPKINSKAEALELIQEDIDKREMLLKEKIKSSHLKDYMQMETTLFDCGRKNFLRLKERFKHDDVKLGQVIKDWIYYMEAISDMVYESEMLDVATSNEDADEHRNMQDELAVKIKEIDKRSKELLGADYTDPQKLF